MQINNLTYGNKTATNVFIRLVLDGADPGSSGFLYYQVKTADGIVCEEGNVSFTSAWVDTWDGSRGAVNTLLTVERPYIVEAPTTTTTSTIAPSTTTTSTTVAPTTTTTTTV